MKALAKEHNLAVKKAEVVQRDCSAAIAEMMPFILLLKKDEIAPPVLVGGKELVYSVSDEENRRKYSIQRAKRDENILKLVKKNAKLIHYAIDQFKTVETVIVKLGVYKTVIKDANALKAGNLLVMVTAIVLLLNKLSKMKFKKT